jgi:hypothetical protein
MRAVRVQADCLNAGPITELKALKMDFRKAESHLTLVEMLHLCVPDD